VVVVHVEEVLAAAAVCAPVAVQQRVVGRELVGTREALV
jgi:hypothetical protein